MSPEINSEVRETTDTNEIGIKYEIENVEVVVSEVQRFSLYRVTLADEKGGVATIALWQTAVTTPKSKLGAFMTLLGSNTDKWIHKRIIFKDWRQGARIIELVK